MNVKGLEPGVERAARVLEIGCAAGGNVIPFAVTHPNAHVVGIDLSEVQIGIGRTRVQALGIDNLDLIAGDLARRKAMLEKGLAAFEAAKVEADGAGIDAHDARHQSAAARS